MLRLLRKLPTVSRCYENKLDCSGCHKQPDTTVFFWFKIARFQGLYYTFNDMYIFLQASCSWMDGRPLLYENIWGYDDRIHNNYAMLLWGPLIYLGGAYGAFAVQAGLWLVMACCFVT